MNRFSMSFAATAMAGLLSSASAGAVTWDMPTAYAEGSFHTRNIVQFADEVREATNGEIDIKVHSGGSLFGHAEIPDAVRDQLVPVGEFLLSRLANEHHIFALDSLPFVASSYDESKKLWDASRASVAEKLGQEGLTVLFSVPWPGQSLYLHNEITDPAQLQGLSFRSYNVITDNLAGLLGMIPTQVEETDIPTAFSTGRVESMLTSPTTGVNVKAWDFVTHYIDVQAWLPKNVVVVNTAAFDALDEEDREKLMKAAAVAEERGWEMSREETKTAVDKLREGGISILEPSEALVVKLKEVGDVMTQEWLTQAGEGGVAVIEAYRSN